MSAFEGSTTTLRAILSHPSLQRESVEKTMEAMAEANADARELDDVIRIGGDVALGADLDVDDELEELVQQAAEDDKTKQESAIREKLDKVPTPPKDAEKEKPAERVKDPVAA